MSLDDPRPVERLSAKAARRIALAAQGFGSRHGVLRPAPRRIAAVAPEAAEGVAAPSAAPEARMDAGTIRRAVDRLGLLQIDSVNVVVRSHYLPLYSRLGPYPMPVLDRIAAGRRRALFEYWGHEASLLPVSLYPLMRWRMARAEAGIGIYGGLARFAVEQRAFVDEVRAEIEARGPLSAGELQQGGRGEGGWWGWSDGKKALEWLFWAGQVTTAARRGFERVYDLTERVLPADVLALPVPDAEEAQRRLVLRAIRALGIASEPCLRDYYRLDTTDSKRRVAELVEDGRLVPVAVEGWPRVVYRDPEARVPRRIEARALLSPFDSLIFERERTEKLFGFRYRLAFYTPAEQRSHGYYVMPFLFGDRFAARVDVKADRAAGVLRALAVHAEPHAPPETAVALADELATLAAFLGLAGVAAEPAGDLGPALAAELARRG
jgi:uncharacterized protein YcaQ